MQNASSKKTIQELKREFLLIILFPEWIVVSEKKIPLPHEVRQWALSTILNCADRWEIKFTDMFNRLLELLGRDLLKESIRLQQVRDIFGIRAVDQIRSELGLS